MLLITQVYEWVFSIQQYLDIKPSQEEARTIEVASIFFSHKTSENETKSVITKESASINSSWYKTQLLRRLQQNKTDSGNLSIKPMTEDVFNSETLECPNTFKSHLFFRKQLEMRNSLARTEQCNDYFKLLYKVIYHNDFRGNNWHR